MAFLKHIAILFFAISVVACKEEFIPVLDVEPVLCINSLITAGDSIEVNVSHTWIYNDMDAQKNHSVDDAVVSIYANGNIVGADYIPAEGDRILIVAESQKYGHAEAEVTVPYAVPIKSVRYTIVPLSVDSVTQENFEMFGSLSFNLNVELEIEDLPDIDNYFKYSSYSFEPDDSLTCNDIEMMDSSYVSFFSGNLLYDSDPIFSEHISAFDSMMGGDSFGFTFFSDRQFSGKTYTLHLQYTGGGYYVRSLEWNPYLLDCGLELLLHTVSKSYYNWNNYVWLKLNGYQEQIGDVGLGDPMMGYSNVSTGAGVVAARSTAKYEINFKDFLMSVLNKKVAE